MLDVFLNKLVPFPLISSFLLSSAVLDDIIYFSFGSLNDTSWTITIVENGIGCLKLYEAAICFYFYHEWLICIIRTKLVFVVLARPSLLTRDSFSPIVGGPFCLYWWLRALSSSGGSIRKCVTIVSRNKGLVHSPINSRGHHPISWLDSCQLRIFCELSVMLPR